MKKCATACSARFPYLVRGRDASSGFAKIATALLGRNLQYSNPLSFSRTERIILPERLDSATPAEAALNLAEIAFLNRWFGGHAISRSLLRRFVSSNERFTLLDIGAASGDIARALSGAFPQARITCLDLLPRNLTLAPAPRLAADAFALPFRPGSFDFVHCSLFLHHFSDTQVIELLAAMHRTARRSVILQDLERHPLAYRFLPLTRPLFRWSPLVLHDGPVSVAAAFTPAELLSLAHRAGLSSARIRRHFPFFRLSLSAPAHHLS